MSEELGQINKPEVSDVKGERRLFFVPLVGVWLESQTKPAEVYQRYWQQINEHVGKLEDKLGSVRRIYHEFLIVAGDEGLQIIKGMSASSGKCIEPRTLTGASIEKLEDTAILSEFLDWSRCLTIGLQSQAARQKVQDDFNSSSQRRNEYIVKQIDETLLPGESGLLFMREDHQLQFPADIQVFYVSPPVLDELKRYLRDEDEKARKEAMARAGQPAKKENESGEEATPEKDGEKPPESR